MKRAPSAVPIINSGGTRGKSPAVVLPTLLPPSSSSQHHHGLHSSSSSNRQKRRAFFVTIASFAAIIVLFLFVWFRSSLNVHPSSIDGRDDQDGNRNVGGTSPGGFAARGVAVLLNRLRGSNSEESARYESLKDDDNAVKIQGAIVTIRNSLSETEAALDGYLAQYREGMLNMINNNNKEKEGSGSVNNNNNKEKEKEGSGSVNGNDSSAVMATKTTQQDVHTIVHKTPTTQQQMFRLKKQRDHLTVRYDRTSFTPYAPSISMPTGAGWLMGTEQQTAAGSVLTIGSAKPKRAVAIHKGAQWHRRQWAIPHPRHTPSIVAARKELFKTKAGGHRPRQLIVPENDDSIFATIASYRDDQCDLTVLDMFTKSKYAENLYVGIVQQHDNNPNPTPDKTCIPPQFGKTILNGGVSGGSSMRKLAASSVDHNDAQQQQQVSNNNIYSSWRQGGRANGVGCQHDYGFCPTDNIRIRHILPKHCKGPTFGRYLGFLMYRGEQFIFMMDSHNRFVTHWDVLLVKMYKDTKRDLKVSKPVLSHYPEAWNNPDDDDKKDKNRAANMPLDNRQTTAYLCKANFVQYGIPRLEAIIVSKPARALPQPWAAAGFLFADAALVREVPFDPYLDYVFDGEEVTYSVRMWTHGWNIFSPTENVIYHYYGRKNAKRFWGLLPPNWGERKAVSERRIQYLMHARNQNAPETDLVAVPKELDGLLTNTVVGKIYFHFCNGDQKCFVELRKLVLDVAKIVGTVAGGGGGGGGESSDTDGSLRLLEGFISLGGSDAIVRGGSEDYVHLARGNPSAVPLILSSALEALEFILVDSVKRTAVQQQVLDKIVALEKRQQEGVAAGGREEQIERRKLIVSLQQQKRLALFNLLVEDMKESVATAGAPPFSDDLEAKRTASFNSPPKASLRFLNNIGHFGMGTKRTVEQWWQYVNMNRTSRSVDHDVFCNKRTPVAKYD